MMLLFWGISMSASYAQDLTFSLEPSTDNVSQGETFSVDVTVLNFTNILSMEYNVNWDETKIEYVSKENITTELPAFNANSIGDVPMNTSQGFMKVLWIDFTNFQAYSLPDNTVLFSLTFEALEDGDVSLFLDTFEVFDGDENEITPAINNADITIGEGDGGNEDALTITVGDATDSTGTQVCLPVTVEGFTDLESLQFSMAYDEAQLAYSEVQNFALPGSAETSLGTPPTEPEGTIRFTWSNPDGESNTLTDDTALFDICFDIIGTEGVVTDVEITDTPLVREAIRAEVGEIDVERNDGSVTILVPGNGGGGTSDEFEIYANVVSAAPGAQVCVDVQVDGFQDIAGLQYSMSWDTDVVEYVEIRDLNSAFTGFSIDNIGEDDAADGILRVQWNDFSFTGVTLPDEAVLYQLCYNVVGDAGDNSVIAFTDNPLGQEVINTDTEEVPFESRNGRVNVSGDPPPPSDCDADAQPLCISKEMGMVGDTICVVATAQNFDGIGSAQFTITFDNSILRFAEITFPDDNVLGLGVNNFNPVNSAGIISFLWENPEATNVTLEDDTELFTICFTAEGLGTSPIGFSDRPTAIEVGTVDFEVIEFNGGTGEIMVKEPDACTTPNITNSEVTDVECAGEASGSIELTIAGGNDNFTFEWNGGISENTASPEGLEAGEYSVTITQNGCPEETIETFTIGEPDNPIEIAAEVTGEVICFGDRNGAITLTVTGGEADYTYQWQAPDNIEITGESASDLPAGQYGVRVTDANGCTAEQSITIEGPTAAVSVTNETITHVDCSSENSGSIALEVTGGIGEYTFEWSPDVGDAATVTDLPAGIYDVTITDANGCTTSITNDLEVLPFDGIPISFGMIEVSSIVSGDDGSIDITVEGGSGSLTYAWTGPETFMSSDEDLSGLDTEGVYNVTVTDTGTGCVITETFEVTIATDIVFGEEIVSPDCGVEGENTGSIQLVFTGGAMPLTFDWGEGFEDTQNLTGLAAGMYQVTITDSRGMTFTSPEYTVGTAPAILYNITTEAETCNDISDNGRINLEVSGGTAPLTWMWSEGGEADEDTLTELTNGAYILTITDSEGCQVIDTAMVAFEPEAPRASSYEITEATCGENDGAIAFNITCGDPNYVVTIQGRNPENDSMYVFRFDEYNPRIILDSLAADTYDVTITDQNEFSTPDVITIPAPSDIDLVADVRSSTEVFAPCDGEIRLNAPGGGSGNNFTYNWSNGNVTRNLTNLCEGIYVVTITNEDGCTRIDSFNLQTFNANAVVQSPECGTDDTSGSIDLTVNTGQAPFTFEWNTGATTEDLPNISAGTYTVTITEASGVEIVRVFEVNDNSNVGVSMAFGRDYRGFGVSCSGAEDAMLLATAKILDPMSMTTLEDLTYAWVNMAGDTLSRDSMLVNVGAGIYQVLVSDGICTATSQLAVTEPEAIEIVDVEVLASSCAGEGNGEATLVIEGGAGGFSYEWAGIPDNNFPTAIGLTGGDYMVTITDRNECSVTTEFTIAETAPLMLETSFIPITGAGGGGTVAVAVTGGTPMNGYTYIWQGPDGNIVSSGQDSLIDKLSQAGEYFVMVEDFNGCTATATVTLPNADGCLETRRVITPNGDGKNEAFEISCVESFVNTRLEIYTRWGTAIFLQDNYDGQWMGTDGDGNRVPDGVYYYVLLYTDFNGDQQQQQGTITVLTE